MVQDLTNAGNGGSGRRDDLLRDSNPVERPRVGEAGTMLLWLRSAPIPDGWIPCDGKCYPRDISPTLYSFLEGNRLKGDPPDYFRVPNAFPLIPAGAIVQLIIRL